MPKTDKSVIKKQIPEQKAPNPAEIDNKSLN